MHWAAMATPSIQYKMSGDHYTFKYHVSCTDEKISVRINSFLLLIFSTVVPFNSCIFLSCRPFVVNAAFSTDLVENIALTTKGLQERKTDEWDDGGYKSFIQKVSQRNETVEHLLCECESLILSRGRIFGQSFGELQQLSHVPVDLFRRFATEIRVAGKL